MKEIVIDAVFATSNFYDRAQLVIHPESGLIISFGQNLVPSKKVDYLFDDNCIAFSGMGDIHIHAREDVSGTHLYKESFATASMSAINGGVVVAADMPNNPIPPIDDDRYINKFNLTKGYPLTYLLYAGIGPQTNPLSFKVPYKVYMGPSIGDLYFKNLVELEEALSRYKNQWVSFHCEDPVILENSKHHHHHHLKRPMEAEVVATQDALNCIEKFQLHGKLCHYSSLEGLNLIRKKRQQGVKVDIEATPQHLYYSLDMFQESELKKFQMNPPIRSEEDRQALLTALKNGEVQYLATDHAPHSPEEKEKGMSGLTGLDTYGSFVTWLIKNQKMKPQKIALMTSENPGTFCNEFLPTLKNLSQQDLGLGFGYLKENFIGNVTILNCDSPYLVTKNKLKTKASSNPFEGITFPGQVEAVFIKGQRQ